ncbi:fumarylacetoacetate hydrolase family protein [Saccharopolyspora flava]|uniref:2-keto-4-pentenoate hydratase/2-oxohepta-3-ene-1,7-dioic acid hydratase (Catechol pathway) n=1 Tax=Saccharopolyspora flava TaxID=95161 RepID=A0A1I6QFK8_9PSEU|nr:fumarylacetoacetate hydrolase family protein [Saccharopolyspora flava]SFS51246.1 2-keto-4-pentenoate hydratase/2-oxohepta-3-ene-1,7-dioic acid hydratase (catechol pathway) [Saccharopolyspora flava]
MRFLRLGSLSEERPHVLDDRGRLFDLSPITADVDGAFLAGDGVARTRAALEAGELPAVDDPADGTGMRVGAPIARPMAVLCIGQNYAAHAAESGSAPPEVPILFFKHPNTVVGPHDEVVIPRGAERVDWEVELGVVVGRRASYLDSAEQALSHVAGYVLADDVSERAFQKEQSGGQWSKGKCAPTFNPVGPWFVPADEVGDPQALRLRSWVNGEPRQDSATADMIFGVGEIVRHLSQYLTLEPGDLVITGTPEGVAMSGRFPFLAPGDVVEMEIEGLGRQRNVVTSA